MTPKEKAKELIDKFGVELNWLEIDYNVSLYRDVKQCALIAVNEILSVCSQVEPYLGYDYWQEVKTEIEKL